MVMRSDWRGQVRAGIRITGWHVLQHTFRSHLAMRAAVTKAIQDLAGHQSVAVTNRYMHLAPGEPRHAIALLETRWQVGDKAQTYLECLKFLGERRG